MFNTIEKKSFRLKTATADVINTNKTIITWNNLNLNVLLNNLTYKYTKFNIVLKQITNFTVSATSTVADRQTKICLSGLNFLHNYDIEYKCNMQKAILCGRYYINALDNLLINGFFNNYNITAATTQDISTFTDAQLFTFNFIGNNIILINGASAYNFNRPYPSGNSQIVAFYPGVNGTYLSTNQYLSSGGYTLTFYIAQRPTYVSTMNLDIYIDDTIVLSILPNQYNNNWTIFTSIFYVDNDKNYNIKFYCNAINNTDLNIAIGNIFLTKINNTTSYLENSIVKTFTTNGQTNVDLTIEMQDYNSSATSNAVLPHQVFLFDVYPIVD